MKSHLVFLLISCLVLTGIPYSSSADVNPKTINAKEKAALTALSNPDLLRQKAGDYWENSPSAKTNNEQKPHDDNFGLGVLVGALGVLALETILVLAALASYRGGGGSC